MHFTPREQEILHLLAQHRTYSEIRAALGMSYGTLVTHIGHIVIKTDVHKQIRLAGYAIEHGYGSAVSAQEVK